MFTLNPNQEQLDALTLIWMGLAVLTFLFLLRQTQPYGRHSSASWGPMMSNQWGWVIQESPSLVFLGIFFWTGHGEKSTVAIFLWALWTLHYLNRSFIYPFRTRTQGKKIPVVIVLSAIGFNFVNGFLNGYWFGNFSNYPEPATYFLSLPFLIGLLLFVIGVFINTQSDNILINLRQPGETGYKIPNGGFFQWLSCPNLFGEILEWIGFALMAGSLPAWSFALWACCNLIPRALDHHRWYHQKFADYPKTRKAIIPFVL